MAGSRKPLSSSPEAERLSHAQVPPGYWTRNANSLRPLTPLYADFKVSRYLPEAMTAASEEFALLDPPRESIVIDGYVYGGSRKPSATPPPERIAAFEKKIRDRHEVEVIKRWPKLRPQITRQLLGFQKQDLTVLGNDGLLQHLGDLDDRLSEWYGIHFRNNRAGPIFIGRCALFCHEHFGMSGGDYVQLLQGYSPASKEPQVELGKAAKQALGQPAVMHALESDDAWESTAVRNLLDPYITYFGHRSLEFEFVHATLAEQPARVVELLRQAIRSAGGGKKDEVYDKSGVESQWREKLGTPEERDRFDLLLEEARDAYGVRENDIGFCLWGEGLMRYAFLEAGRRLTNQNVLEDTAQVFYLRRSEVVQALNGHAVIDLKRLASAREKEREQQMAVTPPESFGAAPPQETLPLSPEGREAQRALRWMTILSPSTPSPTAESADLKGVGATQGIYIGPVRIVLSEKDFDRVQPGDVLVCPTTSPSWSVLFSQLGALVTDGGAILSHPAIVAREYGIPAVVATRNGTKKLLDGQTVRVDGEQGLVQVMELHQNAGALPREE